MKHFAQIEINASYLHHILLPTTSTYTKLFRFFRFEAYSKSMEAIIQTLIQEHGQEENAIELKIDQHKDTAEKILIPSCQHCIIGRKKEKCDFAIDHQSLSRIHCVLVNTKNGLYIIDLNSSNGTWVNDERIQANSPILLNSESIVRFGNSTKNYILAQGISNHANTNRNPKELEREERQKIITAMAHEMMHTAPPQPRSSSSAIELFHDRFPIECELVLQEHDKAVSCIALDPKGSRFVTGCYDYSLRLFDFGGMHRDAKPFASVIPQEGHPVTHASFSPTGSQILAITSSSQAVLLDRDGHTVNLTAVGDIYLQDPSKQKGHANALTCGSFHPTDSNLFLTGSLDGTCRTWDIASNVTTLMDNHFVSTGVFKCTNKKATTRRLQVSACAWKRNAVIAGCSDGSLQLFQWKGPNPVGFYTRPTASVQISSQQVCSIVMHQDDRTFGVRSMDGTIQIWDFRMMGTPMKIWNCGTPINTLHDASNLTFSPDGQILVAGESGTGQVHFFEWQKSASETLYQHAIPDSRDVICVNWHPRLNQIFVGCASGRASILYDPIRSEKGAVVASGKLASTRDRDVYVAAADPTSIDHDQIYLPNALPLYRGNRDVTKTEHARKKAEYKQVRKDPMATRQPMEGPTEPGDNFQGKNSFAAYVMQEKIGVGGTGRVAEDIRESLLQRDDSNEPASKRAKSLNFGTSAVYLQNQPKKILATKTMEQEEEELKKNQSDFKMFQSMVQKNQN